MKQSSKKRTKKNKVLKINKSESDKKNIKLTEKLLEEEIRALSDIENKQSVTKPKKISIESLVVGTKHSGFKIREDASEPTESPIHITKRS